MDFEDDAWDLWNATQESSRNASNLAMHGHPGGFDAENDIRQPEKLEATVEPYNGSFANVANEHNKVHTYSDRRPLRDYQIEAIEKLKDAMRAGHKRIVMQAATGSGKTRIAAEIIAGALAKGNRVAFTVPTLSLINQTLESFFDEGIREVGVIQADHPNTDWSKPVQICSVDTLTSRGFPKATFVIVDEAHRQNKTLNKWMDTTTIPFIGLSATPWAKGMGVRWKHLIVATTTADLIERGYLSPFRVFAPAHPDLSKVRTVAGEYNKTDLTEAMDTAPLVGNIVSTWVERAEERPTLCFAVDKAHAKHIQADFESAGIRCGYVDDHVKGPERIVIGKALSRGDLQVVVNIGTLTTGVDWDIRCIILARPTKSEMLFVQIVGRGLRTALGKFDLIILDHASIHSGLPTSLGFVTDINHQTLHDGKADQKSEVRKTALPKECPKCSFIRAPTISICPNCGFKPEAVSKIGVREGVLEEILPGGKKAKSKSDAPPNHVKLGALILHCRDFYAMLKSIAQQRGYKDGWASNKYREKTTVWPNPYKDVEPRVACFEVQSWVKASQIRFVKASQKKPSGIPQ